MPRTGRSIADIVAESRRRSSTGPSTPLSRRFASVMGPSTPQTGQPPSPYTTPRLKRAYHKVVDLPSDIYEAVTDFDPVEWVFDGDKDRAGWLAGVCLHGVHALARLSSVIFTARKRSTFSAGQASRRLEAALSANASQTSWVSPSAWLSFALLCSAIYNSYLLFSQRRIYHFLNRSELVKSSSARLVPSPAIAPPPSPTLVERLSSLSRLMFDWPPAKPPHGLREDEYVVELAIWNPQPFNLSLFLLYSPISSALWHFWSFTGAYALITCSIVMVACIAQTYWVVKFYQQLVADNDLRQAEVFTEYNTKFVHPRTSYQRREIGVQTNIQTVRREDWDTSSPWKVAQYLQPQKFPQQRLPPPSFDITHGNGLAKHTLDRRMRRSDMGVGTSSTHQEASSSKGFFGFGSKGVTTADVKPRRTSTTRTGAW